jgi:hypothetical protein
MRQHFYTYPRVVELRGERSDPSPTPVVTRAYPQTPRESLAAQPHVAAPTPLER